MKYFEVTKGIGVVVKFYKSESRDQVIKLVNEEFPNLILGTSENRKNLDNISNLFYVYELLEEVVEGKKDEYQKSITYHKSKVEECDKFLSQLGPSLPLKKKRIYVDMDGVLCDFYGSAKKALTETPQQRFPQSQWGFFLKLPEIKNAVESINILKHKYDVWILTRPSSRNVNCYTEKAQWIWDHLGFDMLEKLIISSDKSLVKGDYLIDDQNNANQDKFEGEWIQFGSDKFPDWEHIIKYLDN